MLVRQRQKDQELEVKSGLRRETLVSKSNQPTEPNKTKSK
jgi:hypothetical protein